MSDNVAAQGHLPECPKYDGGVILCICDRLRACEARVREEYESQDCYTLGFAHGINEGVPKALDAATEAVAANRLTGLVTEGWERTINETIDEALAAIAALRAES